MTYRLGDPRGEPAGCEGGRSWRCDLFELFPDAVLVYPLDADGRPLPFLDCNPAAGHLLGYSRQELLEMDIERLRPPSFLRGFDPGDRELLESGRVEYQSLFRHRDGTRIPVRASAVRMEGEPPRVLLTLRDVSETVRREADFERLLAAVENSPDGVVVTDLQDRVWYVNPTLRRLLELEDEDPECVHVDDFLGPVLGEHAVRAAWERARQGEVTRIQLEAGVSGPRRVDVQVAAVAVPEGGLLGVVAMIRDLSRESALEAELQEARRLEALGRLAAGLGHEFGNLLGMLLGYTEAALAQTRDGWCPEELLERILRVGNRATSLVRRLTSEEGTADLQHRPLDLAAMLREIVQKRRTELPERLELELVVEPGGERVRGDGPALRMLVENLIENALQAMESRPGRLRLSLRPEAEGWVVLEVEDSGRGMSVEVRQRIFEPFFTTGSRSRRAGLGLTTAREIVLAHGGSIDVHSVPESGTRFRVALPAAPPERGATGARVPERSTTEPPVSTGPKGSTPPRVLLVDDESDLLRIAAFHLRRGGLQVECHEDPVRALEVFRERPGDFDLLFTDVCMPGLSGVELARRVRAEAPGMPVLFWTGHDDTAELAGYAAEEDIPVLRKPVRREVLLEAVERLLGART